MKKNVAFIILSLICYQTGWGQIIYGNLQHTEYHKGNIPLVISVPHGGNLTPNDIPDRTCNNPTTVTDSYTIELAKQIDSSFYRICGCRPHIIYCNLKRTKVDCNRNIDDGACGNAIAQQAWTDFHNFIDSAQTAAVELGQGKAFYIDLHAHGHPTQRLELGYLLSEFELDSSDNVLNTSKFVKYSSIQNLVANNIHNQTHAQLIRGSYALGTLLGNAGYPSVPSQQIPKPGDSTNYLSGGYNTANYTSHAPNNVSNGLQIECNYDVRSTYQQRKRFADSLCSVLTRYLWYHQNVSLNTCLNTNVNKSLAYNQFASYKNGLIYINGIDCANSKVYVYDINGALIQHAIVGINNSFVSQEIKSGVYFVSVIQQQTTNVFKLIVIR